MYTTDLGLSVSSGIPLPFQFRKSKADNNQVLVEQRAADKPTNSPFLLPEHKIDLPNTINEMGVVVFPRTTTKKTRKDFIYFVPLSLK